MKDLKGLYKVLIVAVALFALFGLGVMLNKSLLTGQAMFVLIFAGIMVGGWGVLKLIQKS